jgi:histidinol-phosphatase
MSVLPGNILDMYLDFAECQADIASHIISAAPHQKILPQQKPDHSLVTELDSKIEITIRNNIKSQFPRHGMVGEEVPEYQPYAEYQWVIDPIDGTQEFVNGSPLFGFIICLQYLGTPVLGIIDHPLLDLRCKAILGQGTFANDIAVQMRHTPKSQRGIVMPARADFTKHDSEELLFEKISSEFPNYRVFRSCYGHTSTLLGHTCMTIEHDVQIWDIVATRILIEEAGGLFHVLRKKKLITGEYVYSVLFGEPEVIEQAIELLSAYYQE